MDSTDVHHFSCSPQDEVDTQPDARGVEETSINHVDKCFQATNNSWAAPSTWIKRWLQNSEDATSKMLLFSFQDSLKSIFQQQEIKGLKTSRHMLPECCTTEAKAYSINFKNKIATSRSVCFRWGWGGTKWLFWEWKQTVLLQKHYLQPRSDGSFPPQERRQSEPVSQAEKKRLRSGEQNLKRGHKFKDDIYKSLLNGTFPRGHLNTLLKKRNHHKHKIEFSSSQQDSNILPLKYRLVHWLINTVRKKWKRISFHMPSVHSLHLDLIQDTLNSSVKRTVTDRACRENWMRY